MRIRLASILVFAVGAVLLAGCGGKPNVGKPVVAFISNNPYEFWKIAEQGVRKAEKEFDVVCEFRMPSPGTAEKQREIIDDLLVKGVQGLAVSPNEAEHRVAYFKEINQRVPLIMQDSDLPDVSARRCYIGTDNVAAGREVGKLVLEVCPDGGEFVVFVGKLDVPNAVERRRGVCIELAGGEEQCKDELLQLERGTYPIKFGKFTLLDTRTDDGKHDVCHDHARDVLVKHPDVKCLVGLWAYNPPAMLNAVKGTPGAADRVKIVGFDENEETLEGIKKGEIYGTVVQNPFEFGYRAVKILAAFVRSDHDILVVERADDQGRIYVPHRRITKENVDKFHAELKKLKGE
jgi:ribose transport system substrate-binding protein